MTLVKIKKTMRIACIILFLLFSNSSYSQINNLTSKATTLCGTGNRRIIETQLINNSLFVLYSITNREGITGG